MLKLKYILLPFFWLAIIALSVYFFVTNVGIYFTGFRSRIFGTSIFNNQLWVILHLIGGSFALLLGPTQFWPALRNKYLKFHRLAGKLYMLGILLIGISAARLSLISTCVPCRISLFLLALFAVLSTWFAWKAIKARNIKVHRQMIVRSYVCVLAFIAVRIDDIMPLDFLFGAVKDGLLRRVMNEYFFSFVPLIIAEICMVWIPAVYHKK
ncbi:DUF2306 domain-containing protein [Ferruginibacter sp.]